MIEEKLYRELLLERLENPIAQGTLAKPDLEARLVNPLCGDEILIQLKVKKCIIEQAVYSGNGCAISQVAASFLAENVKGKNIQKIKKLNKNDILNLLGINPGPSRLKCVLLSLEVLKKAVNL